jgi:hypothetical protein
MSAFQCWLCAALLSCGCAPKPSQEKAREPVSEKDRRDEADGPVEAPPPAYGNKVVRKPGEGAEPRASDRPLQECQGSKRDAAETAPRESVTCGHSTTLVP